MKITQIAMAAKSRRALPEVTYGVEPSKPYGCHSRNPIVTVCAPTCQYTHSALGRADPCCAGCKERA